MSGDRKQKNAQQSRCAVATGSALFSSCRHALRSAPALPEDYYGCDRDAPNQTIRKSGGETETAEEINQRRTQDVQNRRMKERKPLRP
jgi:hypothetical protein